MESAVNFLSFISLIYVILPILFLIGLGIYLAAGKPVPSSGYEKIIEISKWYIVSVALVFSGNLVKDGFTERETGIKEMQVYDKYVDLILEADNIEKRWKLAEYFATVTPTDRLRERWVEYQGKLQDDYDEYKKLLADEQKLEKLDTSATDPESALEIIQRQKAVYERPLVSKEPTPFRVDIFYLEETMASRDSKGKANQLAQQLASTGYLVKVKKLTTAKNAEAGYRVKNNQIRSEASELDVASGVNALIGGEYEIITISYKTPNYISVFVVD
ncbi:hypothetical protein [Marinoscillum sp. 108]|uniref:hypothetical protein n=1 Tax=Marinoscillum sp. 108 TaxID=2653151 RepID=UPI0012EF8900|nr:hypothetical protein [Marinoscillum sp. 108]VXD11691.1 hypothetical protein MARINOS108_10628 [Marinoscillum sp. 108]